MLEKILNKLGYIKKNKYDSLGNEFQKLAQTFEEAKGREKEMKSIATALVMFPHTVFKNQAGNNYIPVTYKTLKEAEGYELIVKVDLFNQAILSVEKK